MKITTVESHSEITFYNKEYDISFILKEKITLSRKKTEKKIVFTIIYRIITIIMNFLLSLISIKYSGTKQ